GAEIFPANRSGPAPRKPRAYPSRSGLRAGRRGREQAEEDRGIGACWFISIHHFEAGGCQDRIMKTGENSGRTILFLPCRAPLPSFSQGLRLAFWSRFSFCEEAAAKQALTAAISLKAADAKDAAIAAVVRGADAIAAKSLVEVVSQLPSDALPAWQKTKSLNIALSKWSEIEPAAAAKFLDQFPTKD